MAHAVLFSLQETTCFEVGNFAAEIPLIETCTQNPLNRYI